MTHNWTVLDNPEVVDVVQDVAENIAYNYSLDAGDVEQEAYLLICDTTKGLFSKAYEAGPMLGLLHYELTKDLQNKYSTEIRRRSKNTSFEARVENIQDGGPAPTVEPPRSTGDLYDRTLVELLLPAVWDEQYAYGMQQENAPDADMPRGSTNKATGNTLAAHLADIRRAYQLAPLSAAQAQALLLRFGLDYRQKDIAAAMGCAQSTASNTLTSAVGVIVDFLNGK